MRVRSLVRRVARAGLLAFVLASWPGFSQAEDRDCQMCDTCNIGGQNQPCCDHYLPAGAWQCFAVVDDGCYEYGGGDCGV